MAREQVTDPVIAEQRGGRGDHEAAEFCGSVGDLADDGVARSQERQDILEVVAGERVGAATIRERRPLEGQEGRGTSMADGEPIAQVEYRGMVQREPVPRLAAAPGV